MSSVYFSEGFPALLNHIFIPESKDCTYCYKLIWDFSHKCFHQISYKEGNLNFRYHEILQKIIDQIKLIQEMFDFQNRIFMSLNDFDKFHQSFIYGFHNHNFQINRSLNQYLLSFWHFATRSCFYSRNYFYLLN